MASATIKISLDSGGNIRIPVTITNPKTHKSTKVDILPDTGAMITAIDNKFARQIGLDIQSGTPQTVNGIKSFYQHILIMKIGNLKPIATPVVIGAGEYNLSVNVIGTPTLLQFANVKYERGTITFTEYTTTQKQAAYAEQYTAFYGQYNRKRI